MVSKICDKLSYLLLLILLAFTPFAYAPYIDTEMAFRVPKEVLANSVIVLIIGCWAIKWIDEGAQGGRSVLKKFFSYETYTQNRIFYFIVAFCIYALLITLFSDSIALGLRTSQNICYYAALFFFVTYGLQSEKRRTWALHIILAGGFLSSLYGIAQYFGHDPIFEPVETYMKGFLVTTAFLDNPNLLAAYLVTVLPVPLFLMLSTKSYTLKSLYLLMVLVIVSTLLLTKARTGLLSLLCVLFYVILLCRFTSIKQLISDVLLLSVFLSSIFFIGNHYFMAKARKELGLPGSSVSVRLFHWHTASQMILDDAKSFLIGKGPGSFTVKYPEYRAKVPKKYRPALPERARHAHNEFIQIWAEMGIIGLLSVGIIIVRFFYENIRVLRVRIGNREKNTVILLSSSVVGILMNSMANFPFHVVPPVIVSITLGAIALSCAKGCAGEEEIA